MSDESKVAPPRFTDVQNQLVELHDKLFPNSKRMNTSDIAFMRKMNKTKQLLEKLAEIEHDQWMEWSKAVAPEVSEERRKRWEKYWIPYSELSEEVKEQDRKYARKVLSLIKNG